MSFDFDSMLDATSNESLNAFNKRGGFKNDLIYAPKSADGKNGVYKAVIRFIPWYKDAKNSIVQKWSAWMVDPDTNKGVVVDCPSSIGQPSVLYTYWKKLKDSDDVELQEKAELFSRKLSCYALIQVIDDKNNPELNGKIMVYKFGKKIKEKIETELFPEIGDPKSPFNLIKGRRFIINVTKDGKWENYDKCRFDAEAYPFIIMDGEEVNIAECLTDPDKKAELTQWIEKNSPNLEEFAYTPWSDDVTKLVNKVIRSVENPSSSSLISGAYENVASSNKKSNKATTVSSIDDILEDDVPLSSTKPHQKKETQAKKEVATESIDDLNLDLYDDL